MSSSDSSAMRPPAGFGSQGEATASRVREAPSGQGSSSSLRCPGTRPKGLVASSPGAAASPDSASAAGAAPPKMRASTSLLNSVRPASSSCQMPTGALSTIARNRASLASIAASRCLRGVTSSAKPATAPEGSRRLCTRSHCPFG